MLSLPRVVIAAPASGRGKTTVAVGLMAALARTGHEVAPAKVGPDYIDPGYHALATGRPGRNLDPWLCPESLLLPLLAHGFLTPQPADVAVIEGVMGLYDGRIGGNGFASTAHIATLTASPVLLVIDISSASRTVAAVAHGLRSFDPSVQVAGVILNKAGSTRHADEVRRSLDEIGLPVFGVLPRDAGVSAPSRHLGLVPVAERADAVATLDHLAEQVTRYIDTAAILDLARSAAPLEVTPWEPSVAVRDAAGGLAARGADRPVVAIAGGRAFTFRYAETEELLRAVGCTPVVVDPATDAALPPGTAGLYLGGGFPEMHAATLADNTPFLRAVRDAVVDGMPTVAECAGLLYLCRSVDGHPMVGAVPADAAMHPRLVLSYRTATTTVDTILGPAGTSVNGHEFHRTRTDPPYGAIPAWSSDGDPDGFALDPAGTGVPTLHASYLHVHWAGNPQLAVSFGEAVRRAASDARRAPDVGSRGEPTSAAVIHVKHDDRPAQRPPGQVDAAVQPEPDLDHHGDVEVGDGLIDFAVNICGETPPEWLAAILRDSVAGWAAYPDPGPARAALAAAHGVPEEAVLPTSGGAEAFTLIARAIPGAQPLAIHPQFTEPEAALLRAGRPTARHLLHEASEFALDPAAVPTDADLVLVGNPTNPTGVLHPRAAIETLRAPGRVLVVDEAFADAVPGEPDSLLGNGADLRGLLVVRSLTKTWAIAGVRAGYVVGDPELIALLAAAQPHWSVSTPALAAMVATSTTEARAAADAIARDLATWRTDLVDGLRRLGLSPIAPAPPAGPFVLAEAGIGVREALRERGYAVRRGDTFPGLGPQWIRIAAREPALTDGLLHALHDIRSHHSTPGMTA